MNELLLSDEDKIKAMLKLAQSIDKYVLDFDVRRHIAEYVQKGYYRNKATLVENYKLFCKKMAIALSKGKVHKKNGQN